MLQRHVPLFFNLDHRDIWSSFKNEFGCNEAGAAILLAAHTTDRPVSYSRNKNYYTSIGRYQVKHFSYSKVTQQIDYLDHAGVITSHRMPPGNLGWQSWIELTPETRARISNLINGPLMPLWSETIILRDRDKKLCNYTDNALTRRMRKQLIEFNEAIASCTLAGCLPCLMRRIFNESFERGGRFYTYGSGGWQSLSKEARGQILMNGEPVVEVDYAALHPALAYAHVGEALPPNCYVIDGWPRALVKVTFLILLNAHNETSAMRAIANHAEMAAFQPDFSEAFADAKRLIAAIKLRHPKILRFFHSDAGARLMRVDSDLAETVMLKLHSQSIVALPIHDSFQVAASHADKLKEIMEFAAHSKGYGHIQVH